MFFIFHKQSKHTRKKCLKVFLKKYKLIFLTNITSSTKKEHTRRRSREKRKSEFMFAIQYSKKYLVMIATATEAAWIKKRNE